MLTTIWPQLQLFAEDAGEIHPYQAKNAHYFRGESAFFATTPLEQRWRKPSPEFAINQTFRQLLIEHIQQQAPLLSAFIQHLIQQLLPDLTKPPVFVAILRAGVPIAALLSQLLSRHLQQPVPLTALSLFYGIGWDTHALKEIIATYPQRSLWFVDGWTSRGAVAQTLRTSYDHWLKQGYPDFTQGQGVRLIVLADPGGYADYAATQEDLFVPSAGFTAPETLGFSRGFIDGAGLFKVYRFPTTLAAPSLITQWLKIADTPPADNSRMAKNIPQKIMPPSGWKLHTNEVIRTLINRTPKEIWFADHFEYVKETLIPLLYLARLRKIPIEYDRREMIQWGAKVAVQL